MLPEWVDVWGDVASTYVYVANSHDGARRHSGGDADPVRMREHARLRAAPRGDTAAQRTFRARQTGGVRQRRHEAREVMRFTVDYARQFKRLGDQVALKPISERAPRSRYSTGGSAGKARFSGHLSRDHRI
jgi:hypothetical protein